METTLYSAACSGDIAAVARCLQTRDPNELNLAGFGAIHGAAEHCPKENGNAVMVLLAAKDASVNLPAEDGSGSTCVFFACRHPAPYSMLKIMELHSADFSIVNLQGQVPLHYLFSNKSRCVDNDELIAAIQLLVEKGVNPQHQDLFGKSPIDWLETYSQYPAETKAAAMEKLKEATKKRNTKSLKQTKGKINLEQLVATLKQKKETEDNQTTSTVSDTDQVASDQSMDTSSPQTLNNSSDVSNLLINENMLHLQRNIQTQFQSQLLAYNIHQFYQNRVSSILSQIQSGMENGHSVGKAEPGPKAGSRLDGNRPSIYNRRISSEQLELPDGKVCTRVPARRWSKRDPDWDAFLFKCEYCPLFGDIRKYRRKAELVRHQALHFPEQARKFKCNLCAYSATRNEYLKSHMANRHGIVAPKELKRIKDSPTHPNSMSSLLAIAGNTITTLDSGPRLAIQNGQESITQSDYPNFQDVKIEMVEAEEPSTSSEVTFNEMDMREILPQEAFSATITEIDDVINNVS